MKGCCILISKLDFWTEYDKDECMQIYDNLVVVWHGFIDNLNLLNACLISELKLRGWFLCRLDDVLRVQDLNTILRYFGAGKKWHELSQVFLFGFFLFYFIQTYTYVNDFHLWVFWMTRRFYLYMIFCVFEFRFLIGWSRVGRSVPNLTAHT